MAGGIDGECLDARSVLARTFRDAPGALVDDLGGLIGAVHRKLPAVTKAKRRGDEQYKGPGLGVRGVLCVCGFAPYRAAARGVSSRSWKFFTRVRFPVIQGTANIGGFAKLNLRL